VQYRDYFRELFSINDFRLLSTVQTVLSDLIKLKFLGKVLTLQLKFVVFHSLFEVFATIICSRQEVQVKHICFVCPNEVGYWHN
jgi:hypothetical protein